MISAVCLIALLMGCSAGGGEKEHEKVIDEYLEKMKQGKVEQALEHVYFTEEDASSGYIEKAKDAFGRNFDYKYYNITSIEKVNENIYLAGITLNTNNNSPDKNIYVDEEFNPYLCNIEGKIYLVYTKDRIPEDLYSNISEIPDNYE